MARIAIFSRSQAEEPHPVAVFTLVFWSLCLGVGLFGLAFPYPHSHPTVSKEEPMQSRPLEIELSPPPVRLPSETSSRSEPTVLAPPTLAPTLVPLVIDRVEVEPLFEAQQPKISERLAARDEKISALGTTSARSVPVETVASQSALAPSASLKVETLILGQGQGKQPAPEYPAAAKRLGQEGTVVVRFDVNGQGQVISAELQQPSPWPLLNQSALRVVRERWRFLSGGVRRFVVTIRFEMIK
jgi:periplasmic protein TonB